MSTNYPTSIDFFTDPTATEPMNAPSHSGQHTNINDAVLALKTYVGTTSTPRFASLASPAFSGVPTTPTASALTSTTQVATTAFTTSAVATETSRAQTAEALLAPKASPALTGTPTAPTATNGTNNTQIATTAFVETAVAGVSGAVSSVFTRTGAITAVSGDYTVAQVTGAAPLASPTFTGTPAAPTATAGTNTTQVATTAFVTTAISGSVAGVSSFNTRTGAVVPVKGDYSAIQVGNVVINVTQSATPSIDTDNGNIFSITGLAQAITSLTTNLTGTPVHGQVIWIEITDNGTARALTFGASFVATTVSLPTSTSAGKILRIAFTWNVVNSTWDCIGVA